MGDVFGIFFFNHLNWENSENINGIKTSIWPSKLKKKIGQKGKYGNQSMSSYSPRTNIKRNPCLKLFGFDPRIY